MKVPVHPSLDRIESRILLVRGVKVMLDAYLADTYGVTTKALNQAVKRNFERFPDDFAFQLTAAEAATLRSQFAISNTQPTDPKEDSQNRSQIVTGSQKHRDPRLLPWVFTEYGALMAANLLRSKRAVHMSLHVVRAFVRLREMVAANKELAKSPQHDETHAALSRFWLNASHSTIWNAASRITTRRSPAS